MKNIRLYLLVTLIVLLTVACGAPRVGSVADMQKYSGLDDKGTQVFIVSDVKDFLRRLDAKETFVAYFGFATCPWCNDVISILNKEAKETGVNIYYINTRPSRRVKANCEIPDYGLLVERIGEHFSENEEGEPYLYVPFVVFVKKGDIVFAHEGTVESFDSTMSDISEAYCGSLQSIYHHGMLQIRDESKQ